MRLSISQLPADNVPFPAGVLSVLIAFNTFEFTAKQLYAKRRQLDRIPGITARLFFIFQLIHFEMNHSLLRAYRHLIRLKHPCADTDRSIH